MFLTNKISLYIRCCLICVSLNDVLGRHTVLSIPKHVSTKIYLSISHLGIFRVFPAIAFTREKKKKEKILQ